MNQAKIFSVVVISLIFLYGGLGIYLLPSSTFQGDLTRVGLMPERLFGWTKPQPPIERQWLVQSPINEADVFVIGDSFSEPQVWQSVLTRQGLKVHTASWTSTAGVCANLGDWLRQQGFKGQYVVMESIERNLVADVHRSLACQQVDYRGPLALSGEPPVMTFDLNAGDYQGKLSNGFRTSYHAWKYQQDSQRGELKQWLLPNKVLLAEVNNGCALFSHQACQHALFLARDSRDDIDAQVLQDIKQLNQRLSGFVPIWVFVPNKTTAYLAPNKPFWSHANQTLNSPNLLQVIRNAIQNQVVDIYPANNTHFTTTGYLLMGEAVYQTLLQSKPTSPP